MWFGTHFFTASSSGAVYQKLGFSDAALDVGDDLPDWAKGNSPPGVMEVVNAALAAGQLKREFHSRLMMLRL